MTPKFVTIVPLGPGRPTLAITWHSSAICCCTHFFPRLARSADLDGIDVTCESQLSSLAAAPLFFWTADDLPDLKLTTVDQNIPIKKIKYSNNTNKYSN
jgi:hypothetical protein